MELDSTSNTYSSLRDFKFASGRFEETESFIIPVAFSILTLGTTVLVPHSPITLLLLYQLPQTLQNYKNIYIKNKKYKKYKKYILFRLIKTQ